VFVFIPGPLLVETKRIKKLSFSLFSKIKYTDDSCVSFRTAKILYKAQLGRDLRSNLKGHAPSY
jgi:hypothetical protein